MRGIIFISFLFLSGCKTIIPNTVSPYLEHMSHATQHEPCTDHPTNYGANMIGLKIGYEYKQVHVDFAESLDLDRHWHQQNGLAGNGEIIGPREQFTGSISYQFRIK